ncbi:MAG: IS66 family transposase zinc-finger binding domain-containing protein [Acidobacteriaceae bacterium]|nr:IS66 family transposase zinc-finger binding domain-containing protein [Acidobacteriaceae bacterium]
MASASTLDSDALDTAALKALIRSKDEQLSAHAAEIEGLKLLIARLHRMQFGRKSEKVQREIHQLELQLGDLEEAAAENRQRAERALPAAAATVFASVMQKPARGPLPEHLPRQTETHRPKEDNCPECRGELLKLREDVSEVLEYIPARFKVIRQVRRS